MEGRNDTFLMVDIQILTGGGGNDGVLTTRRTTTLGWFIRMGKHLGACGGYIAVVTLVFHFFFKRKNEKTSEELKAEELTSSFLHDEDDTETYNKFDLESNPGDVSSEQSETEIGAPSAQSSRR